MKKKFFYPSRRDFLKTAGLLLPAAGLGSIPFSSCSPENSAGDEALYDAFRDLSAEARPFFRWWWNGNRVEKDEISREIGLMKAAGAGGIEINPIAMPQQVNEATGEGLVWLSDAWCSMVKHASDEARRNGMITDLIVGTGWPFGGEFLSPDETIQGLTFEVQPAVGPGRETLELREPEEHEEIFRIFLVPSDAAAIGDILEVTARPEAANRLTLETDKAGMQVVIVRIKKGFREVFRGAPGGAGPVLDHFNAKAVEKYLNHMSDALKPFFDGDLGNGIRAMFCDSIELEGANWTTDLPDEFEKRRGYDVVPWLPLLFTDTQTAPELKNGIEKARYDYSVTLAELFEERFIRVFHDWCKKNNVLSRYQAYGFPWLYTDLIDGYMIPDIPEGDQWLFNPGWSASKIDGIRYAIWNKYASSGGHLAGRKIISSEAMTNTSGVFKATLKYMKQAADLNFVAGINHLVLHGFNYSPPEAGFPGWVQYGTYFNENNPWWPYVSRFMEYCGRISTILQQSSPVSQIAIMGPTPDIWREHGLDRNPFNASPWYLHSLWQAFSSQGLSADYINGTIFTETSFENKNFRYNQMSYHTLLVIGATAIEQPVANSILQYVETGGRVIFIGAEPDKSTGSAEDDRMVRSSIREAIQGGAQVEDAPDISMQGDLDKLADWAGAFIEKYQLEPGIRFSNPAGHLLSAQFNHKRNPVVFVCNVSRDKEMSTSVVLTDYDHSCWRWDPDTLNRELLKSDRDGSFSLSLKPLESALIIGGHRGKKSQEAARKVPDDFLEIEGEWEVECVPEIGGEVTRKTVDRLKDLSTLPELENFSGTMIYRKKLQLDSTDFDRLELGVVHDLAEVFINGESLGTDWYGSRKFPLAGVLVEGENNLEIRVVNTLLNYCIAQKEDPQIAYWLERYRETPEIAPAGLIGPVRLMK